MTVSYEDAVTYLPDNVRNQIAAQSTDAFRAAWLAGRKSGLGGSDAAAVLGLSKWRTPLDVYNDKVSDTVEEQDNVSMEWGRRLEPVIRQKYADTTGMAVTIPNQQFRHPVHRFMIANVDGIASDGRIVEIKTARSSADWGEAGTDEIPDYYKTQVQHYMTVLEKPCTDLAVLIGGSDFRIYHVENDPALAEIMIEREREFWQRVIEHRPPAPRSLHDAVSSFPTSTAMSRTATDEIDETCNELARVRAEIKDAKEREEELLGKITSFMQEADTLVGLDGKPIATWKTSKPREVFDSAALKAAMPDIYDQFRKTGQASRRFLLKIK